MPVAELQVQDTSLCQYASNIAVALTAFCVVYLVLHEIKWRRNLANIPPGPKPWPFVGNCGHFITPGFVSELLRKYSGGTCEPRNLAVLLPHILMEQSHIYGNICSFFVGKQLVVILTGYEVIKDALLNRADVFSDRPDIPIITILTKRRGIVFAPYGSVWRQQRKFCHTILRNLGLSKLGLESCVQELGFVKSELRKRSEVGMVDLVPLISTAVSNVICSISFGCRYYHQDQEFRTMLDLMARGLEIIADRSAVLINVCPWLYYVPFGIFKEIRKVETDVSCFLKAIIAQHSSSLDPDNPKDLIDMYLVETARRQGKAISEQASFSEDYLFYIISDLFVAGTDTTTNTILWTLLYMCIYPQVQEKVQAEIDSVVGLDRPPSLEDKASLPFTEATIMEVQRMTAVVPLAVPHMASKTTVFRDYTIPKGTVILPNLWSALRDPALWEDPDTFNPFRFLTEDGQILRRECFIPFGIGRRVCMGEQLAKMELFLIISGLIQAFTFRLPEDQAPPPMHGRFGLTLAPCPYRVCVTPRPVVQ
ncbi:cytochrome P450 2U1-like [Conger conger]|uniref:cytochrome P450 2U1-like n=1 Tax=Conger conger TaxID=82655 RepID=UPI002A5AD420|nr:cytochrome P450 2U1-like [Conger conger]